jgi:hypothetical protein
VNARSEKRVSEARLLTALKKVVAALRYLPPESQVRTLRSAAVMLDVAREAPDDPLYLDLRRENERLTRNLCDTKGRLRDEALERIRKADDAAASVGAGSWVPHRSVSPPRDPDGGETGATRTDVAIGLWVALVTVAMLAGFGPFGLRWPQ